MKKILLTFVSLVFICTYAFPQSQGIIISPSHLTGRVLPGNDTTVTTQIINGTAEDISFSFPDFITRGSGGPDAHGYQWVDSDEEGVYYTWTEISATGTEITGLSDDNKIGPIDMGFDFPFYGQTENQFWVNSNGIIQFDNNYINFANTPLPTNNSQVANFIAMLWDDLNFNNTESKAYYQLFNDRMVVQFQDAHHYVNGKVTFQIALMTDGSIIISYKEISENFNIAGNTIGLQSADAAIGLQSSYNESYIHDSLSVMFNISAEEADFITAVYPASGIVPAFSQLEVTLTYSGVGYEPGRYQQTISCVPDNDNYPAIPVYNLMFVTAQPKFYGTVTDYETGATLAGVTVIAGQYTTTTGPSGNYELEVTPGTYNIQFELTGYETAVQNGFTIGLDQTLEVSQTLVIDDDFILGGTTFAGIYQLDMGFVNAFKSVGDQVVDIFADLIDTLGYYNFPSLNIGTYRVKSEPAFGSVYEGDYLPTYYGDVVHWADAQIIDLTQNLFNADINLVAATLNNASGPGKISGYIYNSDEGKSGGSAIPAADIQIFLKQGNNHAMTLSNDEGYFEFKHLEYGTYTMFAELFGKNSEFRNITLSGSNQNSESNSLFIYDSDILYGIQDNLPVGVESASLLYPNPASSKTTLVINLNQPLNLRSELFNSTGQTVMVQHHSLKTGANKIEISCSNLKQGIYYLKLHDDNGAGLTRKLIIK